ncbi:MAG: hypothetical protein N4A45_08815 [Flavobacteriales bacterium]|jgi:hypothetical protein|nr:hypothetical protein [Flavobacteriales bacterium]
MKGISKKFFNANRALEENDLETAISCLYPIVDSFSKHHFPNRGVGNRFKNYIDSNESDLLYFFSNGTNINLSGFWDETQQKNMRISELFYKYRNSDVHDPSETETILNFEKSNIIGTKQISHRMIFGLFLILWTDTICKDQIEKSLLQEFKKFRIKNIDKIFDLVSILSNRDLAKKYFKN